MAGGVLIHGLVDDYLERRAIRCTRDRPPCARLLRRAARHVRSRRLRLDRLGPGPKFTDDCRFVYDHIDVHVSLYVNDVNDHVDDLDHDINRFDDVHATDDVERDG
jgi:hypothetical protein